LLFEQNLVFYGSQIAVGYYIAKIDSKQLLIGAGELKMIIVIYNHKKKKEEL